MTVTASTTIAGVSVLAEGESSADVFDLALSHEGIEIRRAGQRPRHLSWDRVSQWELEERIDHVVLTLRGEGATTPLVVTGWSLDDLELLLRTLTSGTDGAQNGAAAVAPEVEAPAGNPVAEAPVVGSRRQRRRSRRRRVSGKAVVTVALLVVLAAAVTMVLLQSAGVIDWGFLGPTA